MIISSVLWGDEATSRGRFPARRETQPFNERAGRGASLAAETLKITAICYPQQAKPYPFSESPNVRSQYSTTLILMTCHAEEPSELALSPACPECSRRKEPRFS